ncbi:MAG: ATP-binding protein [Nostoc sp. DedQUE08]|uniref:ATP-binding protein n=1 Tax=unclassified Nostoc TaxID=2593658 RepID=UPI002AD277A0|nr:MULTISPECIES: ATP-binding protein [unclassified Nostoc]MDZ8067687.1 ATP-binding protein [Nostoc sp. DedQUE08]MDZ8139912.1 ATP-binding protein [Nostoc sp. DedQUE04]
MNSPPKPPTAINSRGHPTEFEQIIQEKSQNFVGREFVFIAINNFLHRHHQGYFTIIGAPGSGKSAILAKYVTNNPQVIYYNAELEGKNRADEFLINICTQLINQYSLNYTSLPDNATEGSWFFSSLLQQISDELEPDQKLIIAIDGLNCIDRNSQPPGTNLFYLPRYLPDGVYFLLTRRPFLREKSGLLIETPSQSLDLADYPEQNRRDIQAYIQNYLTPDEEIPPTPLEKEGNIPPLLTGIRGDLKFWLSNHQINQQEFCDRLTALSENNFMYLSQVISAIAENFYLIPFQYNQLTPGLEAYYQQHLHKMFPSEQKTKHSTDVLNVLIQQQKAISVEALAQPAAGIAQIIDTDEYEVEEVLENWLEFLQQKQIASETHYSLYHSSFRDWLGK